MTLRSFKATSGQRVVLLSHLSSPAEVWQCEQGFFHFGFARGPDIGSSLSLVTPAFSQTPSDDLTQMNIEELATNIPDLLRANGNVAETFTYRLSLRPPMLMKGDRDRCLAAGMIDGYLTKPIRPQELAKFSRSNSTAAIALVTHHPFPNKRGHSSLATFLSALKIGFA